MRVPIASGAHEWEAGNGELARKLLRPDMARPSTASVASTCLVRGSGDIGSAVARALFAAGFRVALHDVPAPAYSRRGMAFVDAFFDGVALLEDVPARRTDDPDTLEAMARRRRAIPVFAGTLEAALEALAPDVLVDARMRKRDIPEVQVGMAATTIGLGPNFVAGDNVDLVIETAWGESLGEVIARGPTRPLSGDPRMIVGHSRARFVYAPAAGRLESECAIGERVARGQLVARLGGHAIHAPLDGILAGLTRPGVQVREGAKIVEVDPRGDPRLAFGIGERARAIAAGVLRAVGAASPRPATRRAVSFSMNSIAARQAQPGGEP